MSSLPEAPSMAAWCTFDSTATLPSSRPSITHTSHSGPGAIEREGGEAADERRELLGRAGRRERGGADVVVEVEVGVLDPQRVVQAEGHLDQPAAERRREVEAGAVDLLDTPRA